MFFDNYTQDKNAITLQEMLTGKEKEKEIRTCGSEKNKKR